MMAGNGAEKSRKSIMGGDTGSIWCEIVLTRLVAVKTGKCRVR